MKRIGGILVILALAYVALPYWSVYRLATGLKEGDEGRLQAYVEWADVRESLKSQIGDAIGNSTAGNTGRDVVISLVTSTVGANVVDGLVDSFVTPEHVARLSREAQELRDRRDQPISDKTVQEPLAAVKWAFFTSPTTFSVEVEDEDRPGERLVMNFEMRGALWKLVGVDLPPALAARAAG